MRIINVVECQNDVIVNIRSFIIMEEQLSQESVDKAEAAFKESVLKYCPDETDEDIDSYIEDGAYYGTQANKEPYGSYSVSLVWSHDETYFD